MARTAQTFEIPVSAVRAMLSRRDSLGHSLSGTTPRLIAKAGGLFQWATVCLTTVAEIRQELDPEFSRLVDAGEPDDVVCIVNDEETIT